MDFLLKMLGPETILAFLPMLLLKLGNWLKNKDANNTGTDDVLGNIAIAAAPAIVAYESGNENSLKKALLAVYITLGGYLGYPPPPGVSSSSGS